MSEITAQNSRTALPRDFRTTAIIGMRGHASSGEYRQRQSGEHKSFGEWQFRHDSECCSTFATQPVAVAVGKEPRLVRRWLASFLKGLLPSAFQWERNLRGLELRTMRDRS